MNCILQGVGSESNKLYFDIFPSSPTYRSLSILRTLMVSIQDGLFTPYTGVSSQDTPVWLRSDSKSNVASQSALGEHTVLLCPTGPAFLFRQSLSGSDGDFGTCLRLSWATDTVAGTDREGGGGSRNASVKCVTGTPGISL